MLTTLLALRREMITELRCFESHIMPFGLSNAPAVYQVLVNNVQFMTTWIVVFLFVWMISSFFPANCLNMNLKSIKCCSVCWKVSFMSTVRIANSVLQFLSIVVKEQIKADPADFQAVLDWPILQLVNISWGLTLVYLKPAHSVALSKFPSAPETAQLLVDHVFCLHVMPLDIASNCEPRFTSWVWKEFCSILGAQASLSSGSHPQTNR